MPKALFKIDGDGICIGHGREPQAGEYALETSARQWLFGWNPRFYRDNGGTFEARSQTAINAVIAEQEQFGADLVARIEAIEQAQESEGLKEITLEDAQAYMESMFDTSGMSLTDFDAAMAGIDSVSDLASAKASMRAMAEANRALWIVLYNHLVNNKEVHLREIPYILR
jgi:hypothetical protein